MIHFKDSKNKSALSTRWAQMSKQEQLIEKKKMEIQAKLEAQKEAAALAAKLADPTVVEEKGSQNIFSNDGSFMSQYKALLEKQNKEKQEKEAKEKQEKQKNEEAKRKKNEAKQKQEAKAKVEEYPTYEPTYEHPNEKKPDRGYRERDRERNRRWHDRGRNRTNSPITPVIDDRRKRRDRDHTNIPSLMQISVMPPEDQSPPRSKNKWRNGDDSDSNQNYDQNNKQEVDIYGGLDATVESDSVPQDQMGSGPMGPDDNMVSGPTGPDNVGPGPMVPMGPGPLGFGPMGPGPMGPGPMGPGPMGPGPMGSGPMGPGPMGPGPMGPGPMGPGPMGPGPMGPGPMGPGPMGPGPMGPGPLGPGPMMPGPMGPGPMGPGPMGPGPMGPMGPGSMGPGPMGPGPMGPGPMGTGSIGPGPMVSGPTGGPPAASGSIPPTSTVGTGSNSGQNNATNNMIGPGGPMPFGPPNFPMPPNFMGPNGPCGPGPMPPNMCGPNINGPGPNGPMPPFFPPFPNSQMGSNSAPNSIMPPNTTNNTPFIPPQPPFGPNGPNFSFDNNKGPNFGSNNNNGSNIGPNNANNSNFGPNSSNVSNFGPNNSNGSNYGSNNSNSSNFGPNDNSGSNFGPNNNSSQSRGPPNMPFMPPMPSLPIPEPPKSLDKNDVPSNQVKPNNIPPLPMPRNIMPPNNMGPLIPPPPPPAMPKVLSADAFPPPVRRAASEVAANGDHWENVLKAIHSQDQTMWFLHNTNSNEYKAYRELVMEMRKGNQTDRKPEIKPEDKYEPEFCLEDDDSNDNKPVKQESQHSNYYQDYGYNQYNNNMKREQASSQSDEEPESRRERRKRKKSRWGNDPPVDIKPPGVVAPFPTGIPGAQLAKIDSDGLKLSNINRSNQALMQYAMTNYGTTNLSPEDWKKCEDNFKLNLLYQDMLKKRQEVERLANQGKHKYEYDSDEDVADGTWEHKLRAKEMNATERWATELTKQAAGKHHIGDFLPPEELKKFMEKYSAVKSGKEPDLSDYKEYKLREDNVGFKMLQKLGWNEGQGLGAEGTGIVNPINKAHQPVANLGLGAAKSDTVSGEDDEFDAYRKRMMLAYRFRPNPLNNPRRPYY